MKGKKADPVKDLEAFGEVGKQLVEAFGNLGFVLAAQGAMGWMVQDEPEKASAALSRLDAEQRAKVSAAARRLAVMAATDGVANAVPGHAWEIEHEVRDISRNQNGWTEQEPTGKSWGRCACGLRVEGERGGPLLTDDVAARLQEHIAQVMAP